jgi:hypothetical protein
MMPCKAEDCTEYKYKAVKIEVPEHYDLKGECTDDKDKVPKNEEFEKELQKLVKKADKPAAECGNDCKCYTDTPIVKVIDDNEHKKISIVVGTCTYTKNLKYDREETKTPGHCVVRPPRND